MFCSARLTGSRKVQAVVWFSFPISMWHLNPVCICLTHWGCWGFHRPVKCVRCLCTVGQGAAVELLVPLEGGLVGEGAGTVGTGVCAVVVGEVGRLGEGRDAIGVLRASCQSSARRGWRTWWIITLGVGFGVEGCLAGPLTCVQVVVLLQLCRRARRCRAWPCCASHGGSAGCWTSQKTTFTVGACRDAPPG